MGAMKVPMLVGMMETRASVMEAIIPEFLTSEAKIWKDGTCPTGLAVFGTLVLGAHAYGVTELEGGGLEHIVKQLGYGDDPLNQRASVGWKGMRAAERLAEQYMVRIESVSSYSGTAAAN